MTKIEAIEAMKAGKKVTHAYFSSHEWMKSDSTGETITFEDGVSISAKDFFEMRSSLSQDYYIFEEGDVKEKVLLALTYEDEEEDDWENERNFMIEESKNRELTEDERIIYAL